MRTWLYRIASNVCFDTLRSRQRRALPMEMTGASRAADGLVGSPLPETAFVEPAPGNIVSTHPSDPADAATERESIRLAFVAALQHLPPQQRAVLILRDVLKWQASEVAELLDTTVAGVNSALQRAHATMAARQSAGGRPDELSDDTQRELLAKYVDAFERYDIEALTTLIAEERDPVDATVGDVVERARRDPRLVAGRRCRLPRIAPRRHRGQRFGRVRAVQA